MSSKKTILVVDDDKDHVAALQMMLENQGYEVATAPDRDGGLRKAQEVKPDLILLDILMGKGADGVLFARKLRQDPAFAAVAKTPIIVMTSMRKQTGFWFPGEPKHEVFFPIDEILEKPVKPEVLLERIRARLAAAVR